VPSGLKILSERLSEVLRRKRKSFLSYKLPACLKNKPMPYGIKPEGIGQSLII